MAHDFYGREIQRVHENFSLRTSSLRNACRLNSYISISKSNACSSRRQAITVKQIEA